MAMLVVLLLEVLDIKDAILILCGGALSCLLRIVACLHAFPACIFGGSMKAKVMVRNAAKSLVEADKEEIGDHVVDVGTSKPKGGRPQKTKLASMNNSELSIIIGVGGSHINVGLLPNVDGFLQQSCLLGFRDVESGGTLSHLHFVRVCARSILLVNRLM